MSKNARRKHRDRSVETQQEESAERAGPVFLPPMRPNRRRLLIAAGLLAVWLGLLLTLYVTAVFPEKQKKSGQTSPPTPVTSPTGTVPR